MSWLGDVLIGVGCLGIGYAFGCWRERRQWLKKLRTATRFYSIGVVTRDVQ